MCRMFILACSSVWWQKTRLVWASLVRCLSEVRPRNLNLASERCNSAPNSDIESRQIHTLIVLLSFIFSLCPISIEVCECLPATLTRDWLQSTVQQNVASRPEICVRIRWRPAADLTPFLDMFRSGFLQEYKTFRKCDHSCPARQTRIQKLQDKRYFEPSLLGKPLIMIQLQMSYMWSVAILLL